MGAVLGLILGVVCWYIPHHTQVRSSTGDKSRGMVLVYSKVGSTIATVMCVYLHSYIKLGMWLLIDYEW